MQISVQFESVSKVYRPRRHPSTAAVDVLSLEIPAGQFLGVRGAGTTVILASRHVEPVREHCDRVVLLRYGSLALDRPAAELRDLDRDNSDPIAGKGHLVGDGSDWFDEVGIANTCGGNNILTGHVEDQSALYEILDEVRDLGLPLLSVNRVGPELADWVSGAETRVSGVGCRVSGDRESRPFVPRHPTPDTRHPLRSSE